MKKPYSDLLYHSEFGKLHRIHYLRVYLFLCLFQEDLDEENSLIVTDIHKRITICNGKIYLQGIVGIERKDREKIIST